MLAKELHLTGESRYEKIANDPSYSAGWKNGNPNVTGTLRRGPRLNLSTSQDSRFGRSATWYDEGSRETILEAK
jgi:hypothetical protein